MWIKVLSAVICTGTRKGAKAEGDMVLWHGTRIKMTYASSTCPDSSSSALILLILSLVILSLEGFIIPELYGFSDPDSSDFGFHIGFHSDGFLSSLSGVCVPLVIYDTEPHVTIFLRACLRGRILLACQLFIHIAPCMLPEVY